MVKPEYADGGVTKTIDSEVKFLESKQENPTLTIEPLTKTTTVTVEGSLVLQWNAKYFPFGTTYELYFDTEDPPTTKITDPKITDSGYTYTYGASTNNKLAHHKTYYIQLKVIYKDIEGTS